MARLDRKGGVTASGRSGSHLKVALLGLVVLGAVLGMLNMAPASLHLELHSDTSRKELREQTGALPGWLAGRWRWRRRLMRWQLHSSHAARRLLAGRGCTTMIVCLRSRLLAEAWHWDAVLIPAAPPATHVCAEGKPKPGGAGGQGSAQKQLQEEGADLRGGGLGDPDASSTQVIEHSFATPDGTDADDSLDAQQREEAARAEAEAAQKAAEAAAADVVNTSGGKYHVICSLGSGVYTQWQSRVVRVGQRAVQLAAFLRSPTGAGRPVCVAGWLGVCCWGRCMCLADWATADPAPLSPSPHVLLAVLTPHCHCTAPAPPAAVLLLVQENKGGL
jgi:hypothetical protein